MKTTMVILMMAALVLAACTAAPPGEMPTETAQLENANAEEPVLTGCGAIPTLQATLATQKQTLEGEQKELLMEKDVRIQRLQKFKVLKLDREVKALEKQIADLQAQC